MIMTAQQQPPPTHLTSMHRRLFRLGSRSPPLTHGRRKHTHTKQTHTKHTHTKHTHTNHAHAHSTHTRTRTPTHLTSMHQRLFRLGSRNPAKTSTKHTLTHSRTHIFLVLSPLSQISLAYFSIYFFSLFFHQNCF